MATDPLAALRGAVEDARTASSLANQNLSAALQNILIAASRIDLTPPPPVLRIARPDTLQQVLDGQGIVYVPEGTYTTTPGLPFQPRDRSLVIFHPNAKLVMAANNQPRYAILQLLSVSDVQIIGGTLFGDRLDHDYSSGGTHEWGMGAQVQRSQRIYIRDLRVSHCTGDGVGGSGTDLIFENIVSLYNRRQGMSLYTGRNYRVLGGEYSRTGNLGDNLGAAKGPWAGIDIEPDSGDVDNILIQGVSLRGNQSDGVLAWSRTEAASSLTNIAINDCYFGPHPDDPLKSNANGVHASSISGKPIDITVLRNRFERHKGAGVFVEHGAKITVGSDDYEDANTFVSTTIKTAKDGPGIITPYDIQTRTGGIADVHYNHYRPVTT